MGREGVDARRKTARRGGGRRYHPCARRRISVQRQEGRAAADCRPCQSLGEPDCSCRSRQTRIARFPILPATRRKSGRASERRRRGRGDVDDRRCRGGIDRSDRGSRRTGLWRAAQILSVRQVQDQAEAGAEAVAQSPDGRHQRREGRETCLSAAREDGGSGVSDPRLGFGAGKRDLSGDAGGRGRAARRARRRGRNPRRAQNAGARDERAARR